VQLTRYSLLTNPSVEQAIGAGNWIAYNGTSPTLTQSTAQFYDGTHSLSIAETGATQGTQQNITLNTSTQYYLTFYAMGITSFATFNIGYSSTGTTGGEVDCLTAQSLNNSWAKYSCSFTTPSSSSGTPYIYFKDTGSGHTFFIDAVQLTLGYPVASYPSGAPLTGTATALNDIFNSNVSYQEGAIELNGIIDSPITFQNQNDSTTAFQIQTSNDLNLLTADTSNLQVSVTGNVNVGTRYGSRLFSDNFEGGNFNLWTASLGGTAPTISTSNVHSGKYAAKFSTTSSNSWLSTRLNGSSATVYARVWQDITSADASNGDNIIQFYRNSPLAPLNNGLTVGTLIGVYRNTSGQYCVWNEYTGLASAGPNSGCSAST